MRKILLLALTAAALYSQNPSIFPNRTSTPNDLMVAVNNGQTTLNTGISATATTLSVASAASFIAPGVVTIDNEIMAICRISGNTITIGHSACPNVDGRGWDGSTAVSHNANRTVAGRVTAGLHNQIAAEVQAVEQATPNQLSDLTGSYTTLAAACADAATRGLTLALSKAWAPPSGTTDCSGVKLSFNKGAMITPASGAVVKIGPMSLNGDSYQVFGGLGSILLTQGYAEPGWFGSSGNDMTHDDAPGVRSALAALIGTAAPKVSFGNNGRTYWINSGYTFNLGFNIAFLNNLTMDFTGVVLASTRTTPSSFVVLGAATSSINGGPTPAGWYTAYITSWNTAHDSWTSPANDVVAGQSFVILSPASAAGNYHANDGIYIKSGTQVQSTPFNAEVLVAATDGNPTTGEVDFRDPPIHSYTNDGTNGYGMVDVEASTLHHLHLINMTSAKASAMFKWTLEQCVDCTDEGGVWDSLGDQYGTGNTINLRLVNVTSHAHYTAYSGEGLFQVSTGMTRTRFINDHFSFTADSAAHGGTLMQLSEGSGETEVIGGEWNALHGSIIASRTTAARFLGVKITLSGHAGINMSTVGDSVSRIIMEGNDISVNDAVDSGVADILLSGSDSKYDNNIIRATTPMFSSAVSWVGNCGSNCSFSHNNVTGGGFTAGPTDRHSLNLSGNSFTGTGSGNCITVSDNGAQTVPVSVINNYCSGFTSDLVFSNFSHEHNPVTVPNAFNDATPYTPASAGTLVVPAIQNGTGTFAVADAGGSACMPVVGMGGAYNGYFTLGATGTCTINITPANGIAAPHFWNCPSPHDHTTVANNWYVLGSSATQIQFRGTSSTTNETVEFGPCQPY